MRQGSTDLHTRDKAGVMNAGGQQTYGLVDNVRRREDRDDSLPR
jgi:hypothetical protein